MTDVAISFLCGVLASTIVLCGAAFLIYLKYLEKKLMDEEE